MAKERLGKFSKERLEKSVLYMPKDLADRANQAFAYLYSNFIPNDENPEAPEYVSSRVVLG